MMTLILAASLFATAQAPAGQAKPADPQAKPAEAQAAGQMKEQEEIQEDRTIVVVGRVIHKGGVYSLRIKGFGNALPPGEGKAEKAPAAAEAQPPKAPADASKGKPHDKKTLKIDEDIRILRCAALEDLEENVGLKATDTAGEEIEKSPLVQVQGILTMYKGEPYIFIHHFKSAKDFPQLEKGVKKTEPPKKS
jgi:hypothetical protein